MSYIHLADSYISQAFFLLFSLLDSLLRVTPSHPHLPLPLELHQQIYTYLFTGPYLVFGPTCAKWKSTWNLPFDLSPLPALLVSKQMTSEAIPILYKTAFFLFRLPLSSSIWEPLFTAPQPQSVAQMQNVVFEISYEEAKVLGPPDHCEININRSLGMTKGTEVLRNCLRITFTKQSEIIWIMDRWPRGMRWASQAVNKAMTAKPLSKWQIKVRYRLKLTNQQRAMRQGPRLLLRSPTSSHLDFISKFQPFRNGGYRDQRNIRKELLYIQLIRQLKKTP